MSGGPTWNQPSSQAQGKLYLFGGAYDPRVIVTPALRGALFIQMDRNGAGPINLFRKDDNDTNSLNWSVFTGPAGPPGPPGVMGDTYDADISTQVGDMVYVSGSNTVAPAIANDVTKKFSIGIVQSKPSATEAVVLSVGKSPTVFAGLTPNLPVFLSPSSLGGITQTPPTGSGVWRQVIGMATASDSFQILMQEPIKRV